MVHRVNTSLILLVKYSELCFRSNSIMLGPGILSVEGSVSFSFSHRSQMKLTVRLHR